MASGRRAYCRGRATAADTFDQYRRFADRIAGLQRRPGSRSRRPPARRRSGARGRCTFARWLEGEGFDAPGLRWFLDYCCRDDYGAGIATVSAWAGLHYFASRHGFALPEPIAAGRDEAAARDAMLTWPEGNGWLADRLAAPHAARLRPRHLVTAIVRRDAGHGWQVAATDLSDPGRPRLRRWQADVVVCAAPVHVAARIVAPPAEEAEWLADAAGSLRSAPWLVANVLVDADWMPSGGELWWDNVIHDSPSLGYVDARHQRIDRLRGPSLLTWYQALGDDPGARRRLAAGPFDALARRVVDDLSRAHPEIAPAIRQIAVQRWGHAMAIPTPDTHRNAGLARLRDADGDLLFAHSDVSHYSIFEEALDRGLRAGRLAARRVGGR